MFSFGRKKEKGREIYPDEIFLDARNLPEFDTHQMQGRIERPISKYVLLALGVFFLMAGFVFTGRAVYLQVAQGAYFSERAVNNHLRHAPLFAERGVIYDRNGVLLTWNERTKEELFARRVYSNYRGLAHVLGFVSYPKKDSAGVYFQMETEGKGGIELVYDEELAGVGGVSIREVDVRGNTQSENIIVTPEDGESVHLTIDAEMQNELYDNIADLARRVGFEAGAGVILDVTNGEVLALTSFPEFDSAVVSSGAPEEEIRRLVESPRKPFLNRAVAGKYTPGSTVKPFFGVAALEEHIIDPLSQILSTGSIAVPNPYNPDQETVFNDWRAHGWVDLREALAVSSNVYFFAVGGGLPRAESARVGFDDTEGLGIKRIEAYARAFGLSEKTGIDLPSEEGGVIPSPEWKEEHFAGDPWRIGDTYNTIIGQYGFQITPIALARGVATIANGGALVTPHLVSRIGDAPVAHEGVIAGTLDVDPRSLRIVREGMRQGVTGGIAQALGVYGVDVAAKTGTAEVGTTKRQAHSWITGFFPYDNPRYAFAVVMEKGPRENLQGAVFVMRELLSWMVENRPQYIQD